MKLARARAIDVKALGNIYLLSRIFGAEKDVDFARANAERDGLIDRLQKKISKAAMEELVVKTVEFRAERITQKEYYTLLAEKAARVGIDLGKEYPELAKYIVYISLYDSMDKAKVVKEVDALEAQVRLTLYENDDQSTLATLSKNLVLLKNIFAIALTRDDYRYYQKNVDEFRMGNYAAFINKSAPLYKISAALDPTRFREVNVQNVSNGFRLEAGRQ